MHKTPQILIRSPLLDLHLFLYEIARRVQLTQ